MRWIWTLSAVVVLGLGSVASAWSAKEHVLLTRLAAARLLTDDSTPPAMKDWLKQITPGPLDEAALRDFYLHARHGPIPRSVQGVEYWSVMPDIEAMTTRPSEVVAPFGVHERLLHYVDVEFFKPGVATDDKGKPVYQLDGSARPRFEEVSRDMADARYREAGMLPFRIEECYQALVEQIRAGRLDDAAGQFPRDVHAARWAGYLAHYLADNTQPHHATVDFKSRSFFPDPARAPDAHAQMEYKPVDDDHADYPELRQRAWEMLTEELKTVKDPHADETDVWASSVRTSLDAYEALPLIGRAARAAWRPDQPSGKPNEEGVIDTEAFYAFEEDYRGRPTSVARMKAQQQALAVDRIAAHWRRAWEEAGR